MKHGTRVRFEMVSSKTQDRAERHNDVRGTLLSDVKVNAPVLIAPEFPGDSPKGLATSWVKEIAHGDSGSILIQTENTLYKLTEIVESGAV
jgi:hypothetical protein